MHEGLPTRTVHPGEIGIRLELRQHPDAPSRRAGAPSMASVAADKTGPGPKTV
jgi:hypothetical protein